MYIKTLTMRGFKSYRAKSEIHFAPGITAIVGLDETGKSNIIDALRWGMGERNLPSLRIRGLRDLVFRGTDVYPPAGSAEVEIAIGTTDQNVSATNRSILIAQSFALSSGSKTYFNGRDIAAGNVRELVQNVRLREPLIFAGDTAAHLSLDDTSFLVGAPLCILDEVDSGLPIADVHALAKVICRASGEMQFIIITHRRAMMDIADRLYGIVMEEPGVSKVLAIQPKG